MAYIKSRARQEFENTYAELLSLARQISFKKVKLSYEHKNLIYQSSIVLLSASVEEYLRVFVEDLFHSFKINNAKLSDIPINSRTFSLFTYQKHIYEAFINNRDELKILEKLNLKDPFYSILEETSVFSDHISAKSIVNDKKYPSPKNLKILYNRLGIKNIFVQLKIAGRKDYELILRSFLDIRETIAHQESTDLTFEDVKRNFDNINDLINRLDREVFKQICKESGKKYWK